MSVLDRISRVESGNNPFAQNPNSTAGGLFQFTDGTWASVLRRLDPARFGNMDVKALAALKGNTALQKAAADFHLNTDVNPTLTKAGYEPNPRNQYLSWFLGPQGATRVLGADPTAPISAAVDPAAISANANVKFGDKPLPQWSVSDMLSWASGKMGGPAGAPVDAVSPQTPSGGNPDGLAALLALNMVKPKGPLADLGAGLSGMGQAFAQQEDDARKPAPRPEPQAMPSIDYKREDLVQQPVQKGRPLDGLSMDEMLPRKPFRTPSIGFDLANLYQPL